MIRKFSYTSGIPAIIFMIILIISCTDEKDNPGPVGKLNDYEQSVIEYFKVIALGFEFGNASEITRKWGMPMKIYVGGHADKDLIAELESIRQEINGLVTDGFEIEMAEDSAQSNFFIFLGSGDDFAGMFPGQSGLVENNWGLFHVGWNSENEINSGYMYVDVFRANLTEQKHLLREELTQSLGLAKDSPEYEESIFQSSWTTTAEYAEIDRELIRLLYHPRMDTGLNAEQVDEILIEILTAA